MSTNILNDTDIHAGWTLTPKPGRQNVIVFNGGSGTSLPFLVETVNISFGRPVSRKYFLNTNNTLYINGFGSGSLGLSGLFGDADNFKAIFGAQKSVTCKTFTATVRVLSLDTCDSNTETFKTLNSFTLEGIIPIGVSIGSSADQSGALYQNGSANFEFTSLKVD